MTRVRGPAVPLPTRTPFWQWFLGRPRTRADHLDALDGLRGLAVLIVLGSHLSNASLLPTIPGLAGSGKSGVYLFFVLSAFLLTRALLQRPPAAFADGQLWADYALRRVLRIWPLYLVLLLTRDTFGQLFGGPRHQTDCYAWRPFFECLLEPSHGTGERVGMEDLEVRCRCVTGRERNVRPPSPNERRQHQTGWSEKHGLLLHQDDAGTE